MVERLRGRRAVAQRKHRLQRTHGLCERCLGIGRWKGKVEHSIVTAATVVNHIVPLAQGGSDEDENTENLCRPCDLVVTAEQFGHRDKVEIGEDGMAEVTLKMTGRSIVTNLEIRVTGMTMATLRMKLAAWILRFAGWVSGATLNVSLGERIREVRTEGKDGPLYIYVAEIDGKLVDLAPYGNSLPR